MDQLHLFVLCLPLRVVVENQILLDLTLDTLMVEMLVLVAEMELLGL